MIKYYKRTLQDKKLSEINEFSVGCWINVVNPSTAELEFLSTKFKLDKQNLSSGLDQNEIPRVDFDKKTVYIFMESVVPGEKTSWNTFLIVLTDKFLLTLSKEEPKFITGIIEKKVRFVTTQKLKSVIKLFSMINKEFESVSLNVVKMVNIKKAMTTKLNEKDVNALLEYEGSLNHLVSIYYHSNLVYAKLTKKIKFFEEDKEILDDLIVETNQGYNLCKESLTTISNIRSYFSILLTNKLNRVITILTIVTIFISVPAAISGIYGMNVSLPFQGFSGIFYGIIIFIVLIWVGFMTYLKKHQIL